MLTSGSISKVSLPEFVFKKKKNNFSNKIFRRPPFSLMTPPILLHWKKNNSKKKKMFHLDFLLFSFLRVCPLRIFLLLLFGFLCWNSFFFSKSAKSAKPTDESRWEWSQFQPIIPAGRTWRNRRTATEWIGRTWDQTPQKEKEKEKEKEEEEEEEEEANQINDRLAMSFRGMKTNGRVFKRRLLSGSLDLMVYHCWNSSNKKSIWNQNKKTNDKACTSWPNRGNNQSNRMMLAMRWFSCCSF